MKAEHRTEHEQSTQRQQQGRNVTSASLLKLPVECTKGTIQDARDGTLTAGTKLKLVR